MILFLNKKDLFEEKIKKISLTTIFTSYTGWLIILFQCACVRAWQIYFYLGGLNYEEGVAYLKRQFQKLYRNKQKLYIHETCATDTDQLNQVFGAVLDTIVQENLKDTGML
jgi:hypothetical protein